MSDDIYREKETTMPKSDEEGYSAMERTLCSLGEQLEQSRRDISELKGKYAELHDIIQGHIGTKATVEVPSVEPPYLFEGDYHGFNIIYYDRKYYAIAQDIGAVDFTRDDLSVFVSQFRCFISRSSVEVKGLVERYTILKRNIEERDSVIIALRKELADSEKNFTIEQQQKAISERDTNINSLRAMALEKDQLIENLQKDATEKYLLIVEQQKALAQKDAAIEGLQRQLNTSPSP
ncbi:MAG: hypothetical protein SFH39_14605 [Candidatus Magnetobacterium sp. LHC-1]|uniref:Magnetosome protein Mad25 n=1 Tax=Candidatus Magnetobacterium casense TaxID=1455061 RepID=A0ABS6S2K3_9BACT|nr:hypothetical protein [Candidatus Magnetobacterium casensis]MBF0608405.1 hypothetical protein [Nitrospirota bacterium]MBV6342648.1 hypothetical protein [Candidatus Magnetobacterium casensis]